MKIVYTVYNNESERKLNNMLVAELPEGGQQELFNWLIRRVEELQDKVNELVKIVNKHKLGNE